MCHIILGFVMMAFLYRFETRGDNKSAWGAFASLVAYMILFFKELNG
jgi:hypothetical protein